MPTEQRTLTDTENWTPRYSSATWPSVSLLSPILLTLLVQPGFGIARANAARCGFSGTESIVCNEMEGTAASFTITQSQSESVDGEIVITRFLNNLLQESREAPAEVQRAISANLFDLL